MYLLMIILMQHHHPSVRTHNLPRNPLRIRRAQHTHSPRNFVRMRRPSSTFLRLCHHLRCVYPFPHRHTRGVHDPPFDSRQKLGRVGCIHRPLHRTGVYGVDGGVLSQLPGPGARHGFERCFGPAIDGLGDESRRGGDRGDVDDAPGPVRGQIGLCGLHDQERGKDVHAVGVFPVGDGDGGEEGVFGDSGVVDYDIDLERGGGGGGGEERFGGVD